MNTPILRYASQIFYTQWASSMQFLQGFSNIICRTPLFSGLWPMSEECSFQGKRRALPFLLKNMGLGMGCVLLGLGCSRELSPFDTPYRYPSAQTQTVDYLCAAVYEPQYALYLVNARKSPISKIIPVEAGILAYFQNGKQVVVPIESNLPLGQEFYCGKRQHYPCLWGNNQDRNCTRNKPLRLQR